MLEFVNIQKTETGYLLDPSAYLEMLPEIFSHLPEGARRFASDPEHYDFYREHCVKDLRPYLISAEERPKELSLHIIFHWNDFSQEILRVCYQGVKGFEITGQLDRLGPV
ncbi:hypothetical protein ACFYZJ_30830 [Streptomyces sp. NPDC001848]|uniref:hypothetical protein n=1 Tax=Streptomyces sp. NPDC001848 TaxID=3364618 RepID=UPI003681C313